MSATQVGPDRVEIAWEEVAGASAYELWHGTASGGPYTKLATVASTSRTHTNVAPGAHFYVVRTRTAAGTSANSPEATVTTP